MTLYGIQWFPPLSAGDTFEDLQWMPKAADNTNPYSDFFSPYTYKHTYDKIYGFSLVFLNCSITALALWGHNYVKQSFLEHIHCNTNTE